MGRNAKTLELFDFTDLDTKLVETNYNNAVGYLKIGEIELASQAALRAIKIDADHPPIQALLELIKQEYFVNGLTSIKENKIDEGIHAFQSAVAIDSTFVDAYCEIGRAYLIQGKLDEVEKATKKVLRLDSASESAHELLNEIKRIYCKRGRAALKRNRLANSKAAVDEALRLDSDYKPAHKLLKKIKNSFHEQGITFLGQGQYNKAIVSFESALAIDPHFKEAYCEIARAYLDQGELASAGDAIGKILELDSGYEPAYTLLTEIKDAYWNFGIECLGQGEFTDAEEAITEVLRLDSSDESLLKVKDMYCSQALTYLNQEKFEFGRKTVEMLLELDSNYEPARELFGEIKNTYYARGLNFLRENNYGAAITAFENLLVMDANFREAHYGMIRAYLGHGEFAAAKKANEKLLRLDPSFSLLEDIKSACYERGRMCFTQGKLTDACNAVRNVLCLDSSYEPAHVLLGEIKHTYYEIGCAYLAQVELTDAKRATDEILRLDSGYEPARDLLIKIKHLYQARGTIFLQEKRDEEANSDFQKAVAIDVDFTEEGYIKAYCHLGNFHLHRNELDSAHFATAQALEIDLGCKPAQDLLKRLTLAFYNRMINFLDENQYNAAITSFENLLLMDPHFLEVRWRDALTSLGQGDLEAAKRTVNEILEYDYNSDCGVESEDGFAFVILENIKHAYYNRGLTFLEEDQYNEAVTNFEYAIGIDVNFTEAYVGIRDAYLEFAGVFLGALDITGEDTAEINVRSRISERIESLAMLTESMMGVGHPVDETADSRSLEENGPSSLTSWIRNIADYPLLTREEEIELAKRIEAGEIWNGYTKDAEQAKDQLVQANLELVVSIARKYQGQNIPLEDLIQEGNIGLIKAASKFDYRDGFKFSNYAKQWIKWEIMRALDNSSRLIRLPSYFIKRITEFDAVYATLCQKLQREPYREEIAESLGVTVAQIEEIIMSKVDSVSMDLLLESERSVETIGDLIDDLIEDSTMSEHEGPIAEMINKELIAQFLRRLPAQEQEVLKMRFGLEDGERKTLREIGVALEVTRERVRQLEIEAIKRLRMLYDEMGEFQSDQSWAGRTAV